MFSQMVEKIVVFRKDFFAPSKFTPEEFLPPFCSKILKFDNHESLRSGQNNIFIFDVKIR